MTSHVQDVGRLQGRKEAQGFGGSVASSNMYYGPPCTQPLHHGRRHWSKRRWIICWGVVGVANAVEGKRGAITSMSWGRLAKGRYQQRDDAATASRKKKKRKGKKKSMGSRRVHAEDWVKVDSPLGGDAKENKDAAASAVDVTAVLKSKTAKSSTKKSPAELAAATAAKEAKAKAAKKAEAEKKKQKKKNKDKYPRQR
mmetsp:Transcript_16889/g.27462  ORF Transcript_16889/g.27462 Transcript_16889/m.27462 type:complete len:198 (+) Transcript_16889:843-1436(+)